MHPALIPPTKGKAEQKEGSSVGGLLTDQAKDGCENETSTPTNKEASTTPPALTKFEASTIPPVPIENDASTIMPVPTNETDYYDLASFHYN